MKNKLMIILLILISSVAYSQQLKLALNSGLGFYKMEDLKEITSGVFEGLPLDAKLISNYPSFLFYKPGVYISFNNFNLGVHGALNSTGSRISVKDYSGEYSFDTRIKSLAPSIYVDFTLFSFRKTSKLMISAEGGILFSELSIKENLKVFEQEISNASIDFKSENYFVEPGLKIEYALNSHISIEFHGGYLIQLGESGFDTYFYYPPYYYKEAPFGPDWSGFRIGVTIVFFITKNDN